MVLVELCQSFSEGDLTMSHVWSRKRPYVLVVLSVLVFSVLAGVTFVRGASTVTNASRTYGNYKISVSVPNGGVIAKGGRAPVTITIDNTQNYWPLLAFDFWANTDKCYIDPGSIKVSNGSIMIGNCPGGWGWAYHASTGNIETRYAKNNRTIVTCDLWMRETMATGAIADFEVIPRINNQMQSGMRLSVKASNPAFMTSYGGNVISSNRREYGGIDANVSLDKTSIPHGGTAHVKIGLKNYSYLQSLKKFSFAVEGCFTVVPNSVKYSGVTKSGSELINGSAFNFLSPNLTLGENKSGAVEFDIQPLPTTTENQVYSVKFLWSTRSDLSLPVAFKVQAGPRPAASMSRPATTGSAVFSNVNFAATLSSSSVRQGASMTAKFVVTNKASYTQNIRFSMGASGYYDVKANQVKSSPNVGRCTSDGSRCMISPNFNLGAGKSVTFTIPITISKYASAGTVAQMNFYSDMNDFLFAVGPSITKAPDPSLSSGSGFTSNPSRNGDRLSGTYGYINMDGQILAQSTGPGSTARVTVTYTPTIGVNGKMTLYIPRLDNFMVKQIVVSEGTSSRTISASPYGENSMTMSFSGTRVNRVEVTLVQLDSSVNKTENIYFSPDNRNLRAHYLTLNVVKGYVAPQPPSVYVNPSGAGSVSITPSGNGWYLSASANSGYTFSNWSSADPGQNVNQATVFVSNNSIGYTANFKKNAPVYTAPSVSADPSDGGLPWISAVGDGSTYNLYCGVKADWKFSGWYSDDNRLLSTSQVYNVAANGLHYTARYEKAAQEQPAIPDVSVAASPVDGGVVTAQKTSDGKWMVEAIPNVGYVFSYWALPDGSTSKADKIAGITSGGAWTAYFVKQSEASKVPEVEPGGNHPNSPSVSEDPSIFEDKPTMGTVQVFNDAKYRFELDKTEVADGDVISATLQIERTSDTPSSDFENFKVYAGKGLSLVEDSISVTNVRNEAGEVQSGLTLKKDVADVLFAPETFYVQKGAPVAVHFKVKATQGDLTSGALLPISIVREGDDTTFFGCAATLVKKLDPGELDDSGDDSTLDSTFSFDGWKMHVTSEVSASEVAPGESTHFTFHLSTDKKDTVNVPFYVVLDPSVMSVDGATIHVEGTDTFSADPYVMTTFPVEGAGTVKSLVVAVPGMGLASGKTVDVSFDATVLKSAVPGSSARGVVICDSSLALGKVLTEGFDAQHASFVLKVAQPQQGEPHAEDTGVAGAVSVNTKLSSDHVVIGANEDVTVTLTPKGAPSVQKMSVASGDGFVIDPATLVVEGMPEGASAKVSEGVNCQLALEDVSIPEDTPVTVKFSGYVSPYAKVGSSIPVQVAVDPELKDWTDVSFTVDAPSEDAALPTEATRTFDGVETKVALSSKASAKGLSNKVTLTLTATDEKAHQQNVLVDLGEGAHVKLDEVVVARGDEPAGSSSDVFSNDTYELVLNDVNVSSDAPVTITFPVVIDTDAIDTVLPVYVRTGEDGMSISVVKMLLVDPKKMVSSDSHLDGNGLNVSLKTSSYKVPWGSTVKFTSTFTKASGAPDVLTCAITPKGFGFFPVTEDNIVLFGQTNAKDDPYTFETVEGGGLIIHNVKIGDAPLVMTVITNLDAENVEPKPGSVAKFGVGWSTDLDDNASETDLQLETVTGVVPKASVEGAKVALNASVDEPKLQAGAETRVSFEAMGEGPSDISLKTSPELSIDPSSFSFNGAIGDYHEEPVVTSPQDVTLKGVPVADDASTVSFAVQVADGVENGMVLPIQVAASDGTKVTLQVMTAEDGVTPDCEHQFGEWAVIDEPTCNHEGTRSRTCSVCGFEEREPMATVAHTFVDGKCSVCGLEEKDAPVKDTTKLESLVQSVPDLDRSHYSQSEWNDIQESLDAAKDVLSRPDASASEVDMAYKNLLSHVLSGVSGDFGTAVDTGDISSLTGNVPVVSSYMTSEKTAASKADSKTAEANADEVAKAVDDVSSESTNQSSSIASLAEDEESEQDSVLAEGMGDGGAVPLVSSPSSSAVRSTGTQSISSSSVPTSSAPMSKTASKMPQTGMFAIGAVALGVGVAAVAVVVIRKVRNREG